MKVQKQMVIVFGIALAIAGCSSTWVLKSGPQTPGAKGKVVVSVGPNDNSRLAISVKNLAYPQKVESQSTVYVVWVRGMADTDKAQNLGALRVKEDSTGELETTTSLRDFELTITAEGSPAAVNPSSVAVLSTRVQRR